MVPPVTPPGNVRAHEPVLLRGVGARAIRPRGPRTVHLSGVHRRAGAPTADGDAGDGGAPGPVRATGAGGDVLVLGLEAGVALVGDGRLEHAGALAGGPLARGAVGRGVGVVHVFRLPALYGLARRHAPVEERVSAAHAVRRVAVVARLQHRERRLARLALGVDVPGGAAELERVL